MEYTYYEILSFINKKKKEKKDIYSNEENVIYRAYNFQRMK